MRLLRNGVVVDQRTVTAANGWNFAFTDLPMDDGYGNRYNYTVREDGVAGYYMRQSGTSITNSRLPADTEPPPFEELTEEELEELLELVDYNTPLFGQLLGTGDDIPVYPFIAGGVGLAAVLVFLILGKKQKRAGGK